MAPPPLFDRGLALTRRRRRDGSALRAPDVTRALDSVSPAVAAATVDAHARLADLGIAHLLVGGLAVSAHGAPRTTQDVDFLVAADALVPSSRLIALRADLPLELHGVRIDYLTPDMVPGSAGLLADATLATLTVVPLEQLVFMKLDAGRSKDVTAVVELLQEGVVDVARVRAFLQDHQHAATNDARRRFAGRAWPALAPLFDLAVRTAADELGIPVDEV